MLAHDDATSESIKCRLEGLLDLKWDGYGYMMTKLTRIVKLMCSRGLNIDCAQLLRDLIYWGMRITKACSTNGREPCLPNWMTMPPARKGNKDAIRDPYA